MGYELIIRDGSERLALRQDAMRDCLKERFGDIRKGKGPQIFYEWAAALASDPEVGVNLIFEALQRQGSVGSGASLRYDVNWQLGVVIPIEEVFGQKPPERYYWSLRECEKWAVLWMTGELTTGRGGSKRVSAIFVEIMIRKGDFQLQKVEDILLDRNYSTTPADLADFLSTRLAIVAFPYWKPYVELLLSSIKNPHGFIRMYSSPMYGATFPSLLDVSRHWDSFRLAAWKEFLLEKKATSEPGLEGLEETFAKVANLQQKLLFSRHLSPQEKKKLKGHYEALVGASHFKCPNWEKKEK